MRVLAIDDDFSILRSLQFQLSKRENWHVEFAETCAEGLEKVSSENFDVVLCDYRLSASKDEAEQGAGFIRQVRKWGLTVPIIMITARLVDEVTPWHILELGGDDFIKKPFHMRELIARIKCVVRRSFHCENNATNVVKHDGIELDLDKQLLLYDEEQVHLGKTLFPLVKMFFEHPNTLLMYKQIIKKVWGNEALKQIEQHKNALRVNIAELKKLMGKNTVEQHLQTVYRKGYCWK